MSSPPGAPRPGPHPGPRPKADADADADLDARLAGLPVAAHADVLTAEHDRLHRLLATIDRS